MSDIKQTRFLGASISSFSVNVGWNEEVGSLTVTLVEDLSTETTKYIYADHNDGQVPNIYETPNTTNEADSFQELQTGSPVHFRFEDFIFNGILQSWQLKNGFSGVYYEVVIQSPTAVLQNVELIIGGYNGSVGGIANLINIYGYYENQGFGTAQVNEAGMPWPILSTGLQLLANSVNLYSGGIWFKGVNYQIDMSELPLAPSEYRINGNTVNALSSISQLCQDASYDYIIRMTYLDGHAILTFKTVYRKVQPSLTLLKDFIDARDDASQKDRGIELRNETSSAFVVGGPIQRLYIQDLALESEQDATIWPYWGLDINGNAIIGNNFNNDHTFTLDTRAVDAPGVDETYDCSVGELRAVMHSIESWRTYITLTKPTVAARLGVNSVLPISGVLAEALGSGKGNALSLQNTSKAAAQFTNDEQTQEWTFALYNYLKDIADNYYGHKFMVRIPEIQAKREPESNIITTSDEPCDGGYLSAAEWLTNSSPLGLPAVYKDLFTLEDGRYICFVRFDSALDYDLKDVSPDSALLIDNYLYLKCTVEPNLVYLNAENFTNPRVVINLPSPVNTKPANIDLFTIRSMVVLAIMNQDGDNPETDEPTQDQIDKAKSIVDENGSTFGGCFPIDFGPFANMPTHACVPLKSNQLTYGPWFSIGPAGKVRFEQDTELVPWNFNGYTFLNNAGAAKVIDVNAAMEAGETGTVELVGAPTIQIGDALVTGGPNVTNIDVSISTGGITTSYRMRTYTPNFGGFAKYNADKFQRLSRVARENERKTLANLRSVNNVSPAYFKQRARFLYSKDGDKANKQTTPHPVIGASLFSHTTVADGSGVAAALLSLDEGIKGVDNNYDGSALCSLDALFRPYGTYSGSKINHFDLTPYSGFKDVQSFNAFNYEIDGDFGIGDVELATYGETYPDDGLQSPLNTFETNVRLVGFKGPMILTGWGYDLFGRPIPNVSGADVPLPGINGSAFPTGFRQLPHKWKTGPINLRWNNITKVWDTPNKIVAGKMDFENGNRVLLLYNIQRQNDGSLVEENTNIKLPIHPWYNLTSIPSGTRLVCAFVDDACIPISRDC